MFSENTLNLMTVQKLQTIKKKCLKILFVLLYQLFVIATVQVPRQCSLACNQKFNLLNRLVLTMLPV